MRSDSIHLTILAAITLAGLSLPLPAQKEKQKPVEATAVVELSVSGMT